MFDYQKYFREIKPKTKMEIYNRYLFAFTSVHCTWQYNVKAYNLLKGKYHTDKRSLIPLIKKGGIGLTKQRADFIKAFTLKFLEDSKFYTKRRNESWVNYADRLIKDIKGLGFAKARFAIELIYPSSARICVADTHIIQKYGYEPNNMNKTKYNEVEKLFLADAKKNKLHPIEHRWKYWDSVQGYKDSRYWSYCLESEGLK